jgi:hypothetical protein
VLGECLDQPAAAVDLDLVALALLEPVDGRGGVAGEQRLGVQ